MKTSIDTNPTAFFLSADWSKDAKKRSVHVADIHARCIRCAERRGWDGSAACDRLKAARWVERERVDLGALDLPQADEDAFDSHMTAAAVLRCIIEDRPLAAPDWIDPVAEGSMLLAGPVDPAQPARQFSLPAAVQDKGHAALGNALASPSAANDAALPEGPVFRCPIPRCGKIFRGSRGGWDAHVASPAKHPAWHPDVADGTKRKALFRLEYSHWF